MPSYPKSDGRKMKPGLAARRILEALIACADMGKASVPMDTIVADRTDGFDPPITMRQALEIVRTGGTT